jgi:hypothetical protein
MAVIYGSLGLLALVSCAGAALFGTMWLLLAAAGCLFYAASLIPLGFPIHDQLREQGVYSQFKFVTWDKIRSVTFGRGGEATVRWHASDSPYFPDELATLRYEERLEPTLRRVLVAQCPEATFFGITQTEVFSSEPGEQRH